MSTQDDSIDISQLKAFALGLDHGRSRRRQPEASLPDTASGRTPNAPPNEHAQRPNQYTSTHDPQEPASLPKAQGNPRAVKSLTHQAPNPDFPGTIPESTTQKMLPLGTQSQGDTQPASPWVYEKCTGKDVFCEDAQVGTMNGEGSQNGMDRATETEQIDLLGAFEQSTILGASESLGLVGLDDDDADALSPDIRADILPESMRFQMPKTPAKHGTKRKRSSQAHSQDTHTPQLPTNPFAGYPGNTEILGPSQMFKATQALTSPLNAFSDGLSDRPSPDVHNLQRPSSGITLSSPVSLPRSNMVRAVTEPHTTYISVRESQEARERLLQATRSNRRPSADSLSDDDFGAVDTELRRRLNKRQIDLTARNQFANITARSRPVSASRKRRRKRTLAVEQIRSSPLRSRGQASDALVISDDPPPEEGQGNITEDETELEEQTEERAVEDHDELTEENKENVEVPMTVSRLHQSHSQVVASQPTPLHHASRNSSRVSRAYQAQLATSSPIASGSPERLGASAIASQADAVADSQLSQHPRQAPKPSRLAQQPNNGPPSSVDSHAMVPQSQIVEVPRSSTALSDAHQASAVDNASVEARPSSSRSRKGSPGLMRAGLCKDGAMDAAGIGDARECEPPRCRSRLTDQHTDRRASNESPTPMPSPQPVSGSTRGTGPEEAPTRPSNPSTLYETAKEAQVDSPSKAHAPGAQHVTMSKASSPLNSQPLRSIGEIVADPSPPDNIGDIDVDIDILSREDMEFQKAIGGSSPQLPRPKRCRGAANAFTRQQVISVQLPSAISSGSPKKFRGTPNTPPSSAYSIITPPRPSSGPDTRTSIATKTIQRLTAKEHIGPLKSIVTPAFKAPAAGLSNPAQVNQAVATDILPTTVATSSTGMGEPLRHTNVSRASAREPAENLSNVKIVAPNRVFAHFSGNVSAFYPATCTGVIAGDEPRYEVVFADGAKGIVGDYGIKRLELRPGDVCKVDLTGARKKNFVVLGMQDQVGSSGPDTPSHHRQSRHMTHIASHETDRYGNVRVLVSAKQRQSAGGEEGPKEQISVPLSQIYFTQTMWTAFKDREYTFVSSKPPAVTGLQTPSERPSSPCTPTSRGRRAKSSGIVSSRQVNNAVNVGDALFANMAFTLTNINISQELERTKRRIISNGGRILDSGFDELFHIPDLPRTSSPTKKKDQSFHLSPSAQNIGFTCLIADRHCRRAKYIQALALGIPCLATRWITDCISRQSLLPIAAYILPSGESAFLHGAVRSRVLDPVPNPSTATLSSLVSNRPLMLGSKSILLIMHKYEEQTMKHHNFLTHALGATRVSRAMTIEAAAKAMKDAQANGEPWHWIYTHDKEKETEKAMLKNLRGKKRKRRSDDAGDGAGKETTRVVGNEFVIQSLILGQLADG
ncbi:MAG: hypothetical protein Q9163_004640 [Psora crenata]